MLTSHFHKLYDPKLDKALLIHGFFEQAVKNQTDICVGMNPFYATKKPIVNFSPQVGMIETSFVSR